MGRRVCVEAGSYWIKEWIGIEKAGIKLVDSSEGVWEEAQTSEGC